MLAGPSHRREDIMRPTRTLSSSTSVTRRGILRLGASSLAAWALAGDSASARPAGDFRCLFLNLLGGPSHLDTFDPKPDAPTEYRGPFRPIRTRVPGIAVTELFPRLAGILNRVALVRSVYHDEAPIHETGLQLLQTGRVTREQEGYGHVAGSLGGAALPLIPGPIQNTGVRISHGQEGLSPLPLNAAEAWRELGRESDTTRESYGTHAFGRSCLLARRLLERGTRAISVNMFETVYSSLSWDCHQDGGSLNVGLRDYRDHLAPVFDQTYTALILDLEQRGLLRDTLVVAAGEFGRSPKLNLRGGRDHWTGAWTVLLAGGGVTGGAVLGRTDRLGRVPTDRPVHASAIANTILHAAGLSWTAHYPNGGPLHELLGRSVTV